MSRRRRTELAHTRSAWGGERLADVQVEHGYTRIADTLYEALVRVPMPGRHKDVVHAILRLTFGYQRKERPMGPALIRTLVPIDARRIRLILADLEGWGVITRSKGVNGSTPAVAVVKDFETWKLDRGDGTPEKTGPGSQSTRVSEDPGSTGTGDPGGRIPGDPGSRGPASTKNFTDNSTDREPPPSASELPGGKGNGQPKKRAARAPPSKVGVLLAAHLVEKLKARHPGAQIHPTAWARAIDGIEASPEEVRETIDWLFSVKNSGDFAFVVMSGRALAEKWAAIRERMGKGNRPRTRAAPAEWQPPEPEGPRATPEEILELRRNELAALEAKAALRPSPLVGHEVDRMYSLRKQVGNPKSEG
jgi:phage replication O-like protein O